MALHADRRACEDCYTASPHWWLTDYQGKRRQGALAACCRLIFTPPPVWLTLPFMPSFDIVSQVNSMEIENAVNQAKKELANRFDFKGSIAEIVQEKDAI